MEIIKLNIADIKPYEKNAKIHTEEQIEQIKKSIEEFGMNDPIAVWGDENLIVEGHGRLEALKQLGYDEVECIRLDHLTDEERKAYTLAHNKLTMNTDFDFDMLEEELNDIENINMADFGFDSFDAESYIDDLLENEYAGEKETTDLFSITFVFNKKNEEEIKKYIAENGKEKIVEYIENMILGGE